MEGVHVWEEAQWVRAHQNGDDAPMEDERTLLITCALSGRLAAMKKALGMMLQVLCGGLACVLPVLTEWSP